MKIVKTLLIIIGVLVGAFVIWNATLPSNFEVHRSVSMNAAPETISATVSDFSTWPHWSVWFEMDSTMTYELGDSYQGIGGHYSWTSEAMGGGNMSILEYVEGQSMKTEIHFDGQGTSNGSWLFDAQEDGTTLVTWGLSGEMGFFGRFIGAQMDKWVGPDFESGLENLKNYIAAAELKSAAEAALTAPDSTLIVD